MAESDLEMTTRDYGALVRRRWLLIIGGVLVGLGLGLAVFAYAPAKYSSTASVIVSPTGQRHHRDQQQVDLGDQPRHRGPDREVERRGGAGGGHPGQRLDGREPAKKVSVTVPANTSVLNIAFTAGSAKAAQDGAQAFADAYLENRKTVEESRIDGQVKTLQNKIDDLNKQLRDTSIALDAATTDAAKSYLLTQRNLIVQQIRSSTSALDPLQEQDVVPGAVITKASLPSAPSGLSLALVLASGLVFGLILGVLPPSSVIGATGASTPGRTWRPSASTCWSVVSTSRLRRTSSVSVSRVTRPFASAATPYSRGSPSTAAASW